MEIAVFTVRTHGTVTTIGDEVGKLLKNVEKERGVGKVLAVIPLILTYYADAPRQYEVTSAQVIVRLGTEA